MVINRITIKEALKQWAFRKTDLNEESLQNIISKNKWLQKESDIYLQPTVKQLGLFSSQLHIPFGSLLLSTPPKDDNISLAFRTQKNAPANVSLTVRDIIYEMKRKQAWFKEESGLANQRLTLIGSADNLNNSQSLAILSKFLVLNHFHDARELFNDLRIQIAKLGILNMQKGSAGLGNNRPLDVEELRAFVLLDDYAPLIFVNQKDSYTARIFSLVHEFVHILRGSDELLNDKNNDFIEEQNINKITAAFLMPEEQFKNIFDINTINKVAHYFNTSTEATIIRAKTLKLVNNNFLLPSSDVYKKQQMSGGNPYNTALSLNDVRYMSALISARENGQVQPTQAASLIGISYKMLDKTVETFNEREAEA